MSSSGYVHNPTARTKSSICIYIYMWRSSGAFAANREDGSVVTWGEINFGGDSLAVRDQLKNV